MHLTHRHVSTIAGGLLTCQACAERQELGEDGVVGPVCQQLPQAALHALQRLVQETRLRCTCLCHVHSQLWRTCANYGHTLMREIPLLQNSAAEGIVNTKAGMPATSTVDLTEPPVGAIAIIIAAYQCMLRG